MPAPLRIHLSPPHLDDDALLLATEAFRSGWLAPHGPHVAGFERELSVHLGTPHAVALNSGTAALHLALLALGVGPDDRVWVSTLASAASVFPIRYIGAEPVFVDADRDTWGMDAALVVRALDEAAERASLPRALVVAHVYGQCADLDPIVEACAAHGVLLIEDASDAVGARYKGRPAGTIGDVGILSFHCGQVITTSGGGALVTPHADVASRVRLLAAQAREAAAHEEHVRIGFDYAMSNVLAAIGRGQLVVLERRVAARRRLQARYAGALGDLPGLGFMPEATFGDDGSRATRRLTVVTIDPARFGADREAVRVALAAAGIEATPVWKPMHLQPVFARCDAIGGNVAESLFERGLCLPSGSSLDDADQDAVIGVIRGCCRATGAPTDGDGTEDPTRREGRRAA
jgi:pyridoxal phosphate-dependent aminotransferase EpsN